MSRSRERERYFQQQGLAAKKARLARLYGAGEIMVGRAIGEYPPHDIEAEEKRT